jgi:hypothetical protein
VGHYTSNPIRLTYSFRHTFSHNLKQAAVAREIADQLTGHIVEGASFGRYGKRYSISILFDAVKKVNCKLNANRGIHAVYRGFLFKNPSTPERL